MLVRVLDHHDGRVDHRADGDGDAAEAHDVGAYPKHLHRGEGHQQPDGQHHDRHEGRADMQQEHDRHEGDDEAFFQKRRLQRPDRRQDQVGPVVDRYDVHAVGQAFRDRVQLRLGIVDYIQGVGADPLQHDAAGHFALAVEFGDTAPFVRHDLDPRDIGEADRDTADAAQGDVADVLDAREIPASSDHELELGQLHGAPASILVARLDGRADIGQGDPLRPHPHRIDGDRILLDESADAGDLGNAFRTADAEADDPVLQGPQLGQ